ncbi:MAG: ribose 5-phosphate isomerase B [Chthonomonadales bacterium]
MRIAIGSDHAGFHLKNHLRDMLRAQGHDVCDVGSFTAESCDYPDFAVLVGARVAGNEADLGVLICGTGIGMSMAANKVKGVRAAVVSEPVSARLARAHNDANVICMGERIVGPEVAEEIVRVFLDTPFSQGERHVRRVRKISGIEEGSGVKLAG